MPQRHERQVVGILLASGQGTRFGADKLMHALEDGTPMAVQSARHLAEALPGSVAVVRSARSELARRLGDEGLVIVECADAAEGMGRTLAAGVKATPGAAGWVIALGDMPFVRPSSIAGVAMALQEGAPLAAAAHQGRRGHPVGIAARYYDELVGLRGDQGARDILRREAASLRQCEVDDPGVLRDIDTKEDL